MTQHTRWPDGITVTLKCEDARPWFGEGATMTPGPWTSAWHVQDYSILDARNHELARVWQADDARLIAAAPELWEALVDIVCKRCETPDDTPHPWCDRARALLARIKGHNAPSS